MALESATYPNQLVATNPTLADPKGQGDDHIRMIKRVIQSTFPQLTGPVELTQAQLNILATPNLFVQPGMIVMWSGNLSGLPVGWALCNGVGTITGGLSIPDMRDRFIIGAGASYANRTIGGTFSHNHALSVAITPTALTIDQIPPHTHDVPATWYDGANGNYSHFVTDNPYLATTNPTSSKGGGAPHTHGVSSSIGEAAHIPPFMAIGFIIKL